MAKYTATFSSEPLWRRVYMRAAQKKSSFLNFDSRRGLGKILHADFDLVHLSSLQRCVWVSMFFWSSHSERNTLSVWTYCSCLLQDRGRVLRLASLRKRETHPLTQCFILAYHHKSHMQIYCERLRRERRKFWSLWRLIVISYSSSAVRNSLFWDFQEIYEFTIFRPWNS